MRVPSWARWALAAVLVVAIATAGVAANLAVLDSGSDDTRLGTLSARSIAPDAAPVPIPERTDDRDGDRDEKGDERDEKDDDRDEKHDDRDDD